MKGTLKGNVHYPSNFDHASKELRPSVLLLHGLGGNRDEHNGLFIRLAASLALAGMIALRVDMRGSGETGGDMRDMTIETQIEDAQDALAHLIELPGVDASRLGLVGMSFGGLTAALFAARKDAVKALVLWEAVYDMVATMKRLYGTANVKAVRARKSDHLQAGMLQLSPQFFETLEAINVDETIANYSRPVLVVQGVEDTIVPVDTAYTWKRNLVSTQTDVHLIQGADHGFTHEEWSWDAIESTVSWLVQQL